MPWMLQMQLLWFNLLNISFLLFVQLSIYIKGPSYQTQLEDSFNSGNLAEFTDEMHVWSTQLQADKFLS